MARSDIVHHRGSEAQHQGEGRLERLGPSVRRDRVPLGLGAHQLVAVPDELLFAESFISLEEPVLALRRRSPVRRSGPSSCILLLPSGAFLAPPPRLHPLPPLPIVGRTQPYSTKGGSA